MAKIQKKRKKKKKRGKRIVVVVVDQVRLLVRQLSPLGLLLFTIRP
jgi:hypothetical protein